MEAISFDGVFDDAFDFSREIVKEDVSEGRWHQVIFIPPKSGALFLRFVDANVRHKWENSVSVLASRDVNGSVSGGVRIDWGGEKGVQCFTEIQGNLSDGRGNNVVFDAKQEWGGDGSFRAYGSHEFGKDSEPSSLPSQQPNDAH